jgi:hypothetical protein
MSPHAAVAAGAQAGPSPRGPAFGLTENNAALLAPPAGGSPEAGAPAAASSPAGPSAARAPAFATAREQLSALHPEYVRLLVDWAALQPDPARPPALEAAVSGCARERGPCASYHGLAAELRALARRQRVSGGFQVVIDILGTPAWAAQPPHGCEQAGASSFGRTLAPSALAAYRELVSALVSLARREGTTIAWWSPWNEPNDPRFLAPQRAACTAAAPPLAPTAYAQLAAAMAAQLSAERAAGRLLLGELGGYASGSPHRLSVGQFVAALPQQLLCAAGAWSVHAYAARAPEAVPPEPVALLEAALAARGGCAASAPILVTETGAGAPAPGRPWVGDAGEEHAACLALARLVLGWYGKPRVRAILQYSFRDDSAFPVGLVTADLGRTRATYGMWLAFADARAANAPPPAAPVACAQPKG